VCVCLFVCTVTDLSAGLTRSRLARDAPFVKSRVDVGSACVDIRPSPKTDILVVVLLLIIIFYTHVVKIPGVKN